MNSSVIISSYKGNESLTLSCITSLYRQSIKPDEIILVLDTEKEKEEFENYLAARGILSVRVLSTGRKGLAAARNKGVEVSTGEILTFIDDDAIADEHWQEEIVRIFVNNGKVVAAGGPVLPVFEGKKVDQKFYWIIGCTSEHPPTIRPIGCNMGFRREVFNKVGGFDETLGRVQKKLAIGEETDLLLRIRDRMPEYQIRFTSYPKVYHKIPPHRVTLWYFIKRAYEEGFAKAILRKKYKLDEERKYLHYYLKHLDLRTMIVLISTGGGYLHGLLHSI
jgi:GT2 family glycosyltransferase